MARSPHRSQLLSMQAPPAIVFLNVHVWCTFGGSAKKETRSWGMSELPNRQYRFLPRSAYGVLRHEPSSTVVVSWGRSALAPPLGPADGRGSRNGTSWSLPPSFQRSASDELEVHAHENAPTEDSFKPTHLAVFWSLQ